MGYVALLRRNKPFRRLWYGQLVSQLGDWLDSIALFTLLLNLTGSGEAVGLLLVAQFLPGALVGPFAGVVVDRLPRRLVLILSDLGRALLVLLLLLVRSAGDIWLVYTVVALKVVLTSFFEPARSAIIPDVCSREELVAANAISGATWSAMLALGAALGGLVVGTLGIQASFLIDSASYVMSAALIFTVRVGEGREAGGRKQEAGAAPSSRALGELAEGLRYIFTHREVAWITFSKALWSMGGGVLLLLALFGRELFPVGQGGALSIGLLYAARGAGAGIGPILAQRLFGDGQSFMRRAIGLSFFFSALGYIGFSYSPTLAVAMLAVVVAHVGGSIQWVFSTALLQMRLPERLRGRVFAIEYAGLTLTTALSSYLTGLASDAGAAPRSLALALAGIFLVAGLITTAALWHGRPDPVSEPAAA
ncbi:MFS transporter [Chloroflexales bacterium ZM16-3]|nr:MFS transporter [Chloroflexales bacterium ZM16-3]